MVFDEERVEKKFHSSLVVQWSDNQVSRRASITVDVTWEMHA